MIRVLFIRSGLGVRLNDGSCCVFGDTAAAPTGRCLLHCRLDFMCHFKFPIWFLTKLLGSVDATSAGGKEIVDRAKYQRDIPTPC